MERANLKQLLIMELPPAFVQQLLVELGKIYLHSYNNLHNDEHLGECEADYNLGHYRRSLCETVFRRLAITSNLKSSDISPQNGGWSHVQVETEKFKLDICHVQSPNAFPKPSDTRQQNSEINHHIGQQVLFAEESDNINNNEKFYGIVVHTESRGEKNNFRYAGIGFPNEDFSEWAAEPIDLSEIMDLQSLLLKKPNDMQEQIQQPKPKWKRLSPEQKKDQR